MNQLLISDTTLRDGEQAPGVAFDPAEKAAIAAMLDEVGVHEIECGTPAMGREEQDAAERILSLGLNARIIGWNRAVIADIEASMESGLSAVAVSTPVSDIQIERKLRADRKWLLKRLESCVGFCKDRGLYVCVGAEDASRSDEGFFIEFARRAESLGADRLRFADTVGCMEPFSLADRIRRLRENVSIPLEIHCHNDLGLATANALSGAVAGATWLSATVLGIGERAGNAALEEVAMALKHARGIDLGLNMRAAKRLCEYVARISGRVVPPWKPVVGQGVFRHESGVHVDGVIKDPTTYELFRPEEVGLRREIVLGKHSGRAAVSHRLSRLGVAADRGRLDRVLGEVRAAGARLKRPVSDEELLGLSRLAQEMPDAHYVESQDKQTTLRLSPARAMPSPTPAQWSAPE